MSDQTPPPLAGPGEQRLFRFVCTGLFLFMGAWLWIGVAANRAAQTQAPPPSAAEPPTKPPAPTPAKPSAAAPPTKPPAPTPPRPAPTLALPNHPLLQPLSRISEGLLIAQGCEATDADALVSPQLGLVGRPWRVTPPIACASARLLAYASIDYVAALAAVRQQIKAAQDCFAAYEACYKRRETFPDRIDPPHHLWSWEDPALNSLNHLPLILARLGDRSGEAALRLELLTAEMRMDWTRQYTRADLRQRRAGWDWREQIIRGDIAFYRGALNEALSRYTLARDIIRDYPENLNNPKMSPTALLLSAPATHRLDAPTLDPEQLAADNADPDGGVRRLTLSEDKLDRTPLAQVEKALFWPVFLMRSDAFTQVRMGDALAAMARPADALAAYRAAWTAGEAYFQTPYPVRDARMGPEVFRAEVRVRMAEALLQLGRPNDALTEIHAGRERAPSQSALLFTHPFPPPGEARTTRVVPHLDDAQAARTVRFAAAEAAALTALGRPGDAVKHAQAALAARMDVAPQTAPLQDPRLQLDRARLLHQLSIANRHLGATGPADAARAAAHEAMTAVRVLFPSDAALTLEHTRMQEAARHDAAR